MILGIRVRGFFLIFDFMGDKIRFDIFVRKILEWKGYGLDLER